MKEGNMRQEQEAVSGEPKTLTQKDQSMTQAEYVRRYVAEMRRESGLSRGYALGCAHAEWNNHARDGTPNTDPERDAREALAYLRGGRS